MRPQRLVIIIVIAALVGFIAAIVTQIVNQDTLNKDRNRSALDEETKALAPYFVNIANRVGLRGQPNGDICSANAAGIAILNHDRDGTDLVLGSYEGNTIVWRIKNERASIKQNLGTIGETTGLSAADYNNDGANDLLVVTQNGPHLYESQKGRLVDVTQKSGLRATSLGMAGAWADFNRDGLLDLAIAQGNNCVAGDREYHFGRMVLYRQNRDHTFSPANQLLVDPPEPGLGMAVAFTDLDNDGWLDIYQGNDILGGVKNQAWQNIKGRRFVSGFKSSEIEINSMGLGLGDINNDQKIDISISNIDPIRVLLSQRQAFGPGRFEPDYITHNLRQANPNRVIVTWGLITEDFNNDGAEDIWSPAGGIEDAAPEPQSFFINKAKGPSGNKVLLEEIGQDIGLDTPLRGRSAATVDLNNDGLLDVALNSLNSPPALFLNKGSRKKGGFIAIRLVGDPKKGSPRSACGARLSLTIGEKSWIREVECGSEGYLASSDKTVHFGTGQALGEGALTIRWPSGSEEVREVQPNRQYQFSQ